MSMSLLRTGVLVTGLTLAGSVWASPPPAIDVFVDGAFAGQVSWVADLSVPGGWTTAQTFLSGSDVRVGESFFSPTSTPNGTGWDFSYGLGFTFTGAAAKTLTVVYDLPFASPLNGPVDGLSSIIGVIVDGTGNGVQLSAPVGGHVQSVTMLPGLGNNALLSVGPTVTGAASGNSGTSFDYGEFAASTTFGNGSSSWSGMRVRTEFTLQPGNSAASIDGVITVSPVPEPSALAMALAGLAVLAGVARRRSPAA